MYLSPADLGGLGDAGLRETVGDKAAQLIRFHWEAVAAGEPGVPDFQVAPASCLADFYERRWTSPELRYPEVPAAESVPVAVADIMVEFGRYALRAGLLGGPDRAVLRSSLVWPGAGGRAAGVDTTVLAEAQPGAAAARLAAGLYKAYTSVLLASAGHALDSPRPAGIIAMPLLDFAWQGTAYVHDAHVATELMTPDGVVYADAPSALSMLSRKGAGRLFDGVRCWGQPGHVVEVEFLLRSDEGIHVMQRRVMPVHRDRAGRPTLLHAGGAYRGEAVDLRGRRRDELTAEQVREMLVSAKDRALIVPLKHSTDLDAFAVLWACAQPTAPSAPAAIVLTHDGGTQAGMATHLRWAIVHALPEALVVRAPERVLPAGTASLSIDSDGVRATVVAR